MGEGIRLVEGVAAGREHIARLRGRIEPPVTPAMRARLREIFERELSPQEAVAQIVTDVRRHGDAALRDYTRRIDGVTLDTFTADTEAIEAAYQATPAPLRDALHLAAGRIRAFHEREPRGSWLQWDDEGGALGQTLRPLQRVGVYVPGGRAAYPSSLLMTVIPAQVAGVEEIVVTTPPMVRQLNSRTASNGTPVILAAARVIGLKQVFLLGGAQAVAALAYGTQSVARVDKIVGAGGLFVTLAKRLVYGDVGIDGLYGPTETLLIADEAANPVLAAADLLAQAEHDPLATALLITPSPQLAEAVQREVGRQLSLLERAEFIAAALHGQGAIIVVADLNEALALANEYAPEHLCLLVADPWPLVGRVRNAGGIFVGEQASEALGDYIVGPSHVMPTGGTARFGSPLHVRDFLKVTSIFAPGETTARRLAPAAQTIARAEGLTAHAVAIAARRQGSGGAEEQGSKEAEEQGSRGDKGTASPHPSTSAPPHRCTPALIRSHIKEIEPYEPPDLEAVAARAGVPVKHLIRLDANENPFGPSPRVAQALAEFADYGFYPDYRPLREAVACYAGVTPEHVVLGNGSDELIDLVLRLCLEPGQGLIICPPAFSMYRFFARLGRHPVWEIPRGDDFSVDATAIETLARQSEGQAQPRLLFLTSPGNPDGQIIPLDTVLRLLRLPWVIVVDEAYVEFGGPSVLPLLAEHDNLIILRTFSKWAGLAGLRLGYALLAPQLAAHMERTRAPYNVNSAAMVAALATLENLKSVQANVARLIAERERLQAALAAISWLEPLPSQANFILCRLHGRTGGEVAGELAQRGILVRSFSEHRLAGYVRIAVGRPEQNEALLKTLPEL